MICSSHGRRRPALEKLGGVQYLRSATFFVRGQAEFPLRSILSFHQGIYTTKPIGGYTGPFHCCIAVLKASRASCLVRNCAITHICRTTDHHAMDANVHVRSQTCDALVEQFKSLLT